MGTDAASEAFSSMKVNVEQISALGPSLVKNDKLVVRIQGHYFPWDAAAPIILGMASFGKDHVFEHQGMIAVDRTEKNLKADTMNGSWRLWPFSFKRSKSISAVQSTPESTILMDSKGTGSCRNLSGGKIMRKPKVMKERSLTPSSEEIASLNLKEGQNVVTFGFSTAMLGQQQVIFPYFFHLIYIFVCSPQHVFIHISLIVQVDARIYLWKWNTRIVVSDVDGTITKYVLYNILSWMLLVFYNIHKDYNVLNLIPVFSHSYMEWISTLPSYLLRLANVYGHGRIGA